MDIMWIMPSLKSRAHLRDVTSEQSDRRFGDSLTAGTTNTQIHFIGTREGRPSDAVGSRTDSPFTGDMDHDS